MLEKTAASLEPCGLQRILPVATKSFRSRRQLHTAFWQHGAADVELTNAWQVLMHGVFDADVDTALTGSLSDTSDPRHPALRASSFLLDFLYPVGSVAFLRRFSPASSDRLDVYKPTATFAKVSPRLYSSSVAAPESVKVELNGAGHVMAHGHAVSKSPRGHFKDNHGMSAVPQSSATDPPHTKGSVLTHGAGLSPSQDSGNVDQGSTNHLRELITLLVSDKAEDADKVWYHYTALDQHSRQRYLGQTLVFLSKTGRVTDSWKISELFHQVDPQSWDSYLFVAGMEAEMNLQNVQDARAIFVKGLENLEIDQSSLVTALDLMLAAALRSTTVEPLHDLWQLYDKMVSRLDFEGVTSQLSRVSAVPGLSGIIIAYKPFFKKAKSLKGSDELKKLLVRRALVACPDRHVLTLLHMTNDHLAFEEMIRSSKGSQNDRKFLLPQVYKIYRGLPRSCPSHAVLYTIFQAYKSMSSSEAKLTGMEMLWGDWLTFHKTPTRRAYQKFLAFHASTGNTKHVYKLWKEYLCVHGEAVVLKGDDTFTHLLQVHAVRGELSKVQQVFDEITTKFRLTPNRYCWTILLNAYAKAGDYEGAIETFEKLCVNLGGMDRVSVGTLMQMAADRGDLGFAVDLYRRARRGNIPTNDVPILCSLVDVYCQNGLFQQAEELCVRAAGKGIKEPRLWNIMLDAHAHRRNLVAINRILTLMTELDVPYNQYTYQELLLGLSLCRQPQHALHLLSVAIQDGSFEVNEEHFLTVMGAFIKSGEVDVAARVHKLMQQCGFKESADSLVTLATAFNQWSRLPHMSKKGHKQQTLLNAALRRFYRVYGIRDPKAKLAGEALSTEETSTPKNVLQSSKQIHQFSRLIYIFTQMRDYAKVQELIDMYRYVVYGDAKSKEPLPIKLLSGIMRGDLAEKKYDALEQTWRLMFSMAQEKSLSAGWSENLPTSQRISPRYRYILNDGLKMMQTMYIEQGDVASLRALLEEVRAAGFEVDSRNWNLYVQGLVQCHAYKEAFEVCEKWLMTNWTGWLRARARASMKNLIPLDLRRRGTWPRYLRPVSHTLYYLAKGYVDLDKMSPWSSEATSIMRTVQQNCPRCYKAISTMIRQGTNIEQEILGGSLANAALEAELELLDESVDDDDDVNLAKHATDAEPNADEDGWASGSDLDKE